MRHVHLADQVRIEKLLKPPFHQRGVIPPPTAADDRTLDRAPIHKQNCGATARHRPARLAQSRSPSFNWLHLGETRGEIGPQEVVNPPRRFFVTGS
jgi:hypothetical protein